MLWVGGRRAKVADPGLAPGDAHDSRSRQGEGTRISRRDEGPGLWTRGTLGGRGEARHVPEGSTRGPWLPTRGAVPARGRSGAGGRGARPRLRGGGLRADAAGCDRLGEDVHRRQGHRLPQPADARALPQQDAGGAALPGVQGVLPRQRGRVLRLVLRLLPARGVRPFERHLHREGDLDQRGDRPPEARRHSRPVRAARRRDRRVGVVHLRPRRPGRSSNGATS